MRALVCEAYGGPDRLGLREVDRPACKPDAVVVRVIGAGLNFADLIFIRGEYQLKAEPPFVPGAEVFGEVCEVGCEVEGVKPGELLMGQVLTGGYAQFVAVDPRQAVRLQTDMPAREAAGFFISYGTAYSALVQRAHAQAGQTLLVLGAAGGVGLAAVQIAKALGLRIIADCRGDAKRALVAGSGADAVVDYSAPDFRSEIERATGGKGCDLVLDMIGGEATRAALRCMAWCGQLIVIGFAGGMPFQVPANHLLVKNCSVIGHWWGDYHWRDRRQLDAAFEHLFALYARGLLRPFIDDVVSLEQVPHGLQRYAQRAVLGKIVMLN